MTTTLSEGVKVPDVGSVNWAGDLEVNWNLLNGALANLSGNVKLDRDNTWTGEQSFTLPIVGSITGTAAKAIADEDGTSIKTGYVNVAGNQTVSGDKSFTGSNTFNSILPNATNTYSLGSSSYQWSSVYAQSYYYNGTAWGLDKANVWTTDNKFQGSNLSLQNGLKEIGSSSSSGHYTIHFKDKNSADMGYISHQTTFLRLGVLNKFTSGAYDPNGTRVENYLTLYVNSDGTKSADILSNFIPGVTNLYNLGSSSYQWSSVYAQTYYYNGTAWGLDKANTWTEANTYTSSVLTLKQTGLEIGVTPASNQTRRYRFTDKNNADLGWMQHRVSASGDSYLELLVDNKFSNGQLSAQGSDILNGIVLGLHSDGSRYLNVLGDVSPDLPTRVCNLGTSTNKWKTLNGVNPGALSFPDASAKVQIEIPTSWIWDGTTENSYVAPITGWLAIGSSQATYVRLFNSMSLIGSVVRSPASSDIRTYIPMIAGDIILISGITSSSFLIRIYPCLGNV